MGMDVFGRKPTNEKGQYFRNNIWYWRPLWNYCCTIDPTLIERVPYAQENSGDGLNAKDAKQLAYKLQKEITTGNAEKFVKQYEKERKAIPKENCTYCDENGERQWKQENGETISKTCNACSGTKKVDSWESHYPMDLENIKEFTEFLMNCGGFQIC